MEQLGKYRIEAKLGEGAMGFVYKAWHPGFNDYVALKTIQDTRLEGRELLERFKMEGQALAKLKHQNIVQIYDADQANGVHFIVMEYINGGGLDRLIARRDGTLPLAKRVGYILPVCHALEYAHKRRLYHRDIKPANIMLHIDGTDEIVKVVDFGIARLVDSSQTQTKLLIGTPGYMAPELITASAKANEKTDIWALGITLYELISYQRPFEGKTFEDLVRNIVHGYPKPLTQIVPECPKELCAVVERTLQKDPERRYQYIEDLLIELEPIAKRLRTDVAGGLLRRAQDLLEIGEYESAKSALDEARKYDASNLQARSLLEKVQEELRRKELLPRLQEHLKQGRIFLGRGQYREARTAAEHAVGLDSRFEPARKLLAEIQETEAVAEGIQQRLTQAKRHIVMGELTEASRTIDEVLALDPENHEAAELTAKIRSRREELERRKKLAQFLRKTEDLLILGKYEECLSLLDQAQREFPENRELQKRKENALAEKTEQQRQFVLNKARKLRVSQQFDQALEILDELLSKSADDSSALSLRASIQRERDQERLNKQLGVAWEELRSLKNQGKFSQALDLARGLVVRFPSEARIHQLIKELDAEVRQDQVQSQLGATVNSIHEFIRQGRFSQAITASEEGLSQFPDNPQIIALREEARSQQSRKDTLQKQNDRVLKVRELISTRQFGAAADLARKGLSELGEHPGLRDGLSEAERLHSLQVERLREQEFIATEIQDFCRTGDVAAATRVFQNARTEGLLEDDTALERTLLGYIGQAKEQEEKEREVQIELKRREVRQAVDQREFSVAIHLANDLERDFGTDREASDLRRKAEAGLEAERIAVRERDDVLHKASELLNSNNIAAADVMLRNSLEAGILKKSDRRVAGFLEKTKEALDQDKERRRRVQQTIEHLRNLLNESNFAGVVELGQQSLQAEGHSLEVANLIKQARTGLARQESAQKRKLAALQTIRALLDEGRPDQADAVLRQALQSNVLNTKDAEVADVESRIQEILKTQIETSTAIESAEEEYPRQLAPAAKQFSKRWLVAGTVAGVLGLAAVGSLYWIRGGTRPAPPPAATDNDQPFWDKAQNAMNQSPRDFREALVEYQKVAGLHGAHRTQVQPKIDEITELQTKEDSLLNKAAQALKSIPPDYSGAIGSYDQVVQINGDRKSEAEGLRKLAEDLKAGKDPKVLAEEGFKRGAAAFARRDYISAQRIFQETLRTAPSDWGRYAEAEGYFSRSKLRVQQHEDWVAANNAFNSKNYDLAREAATRAANVSGGDPEDTRLSTELLKKIELRMTQKNQYAEALKIESSDPKEAKTKFQSVIDFPNGDADLVAASKNEITKIDGLVPTPKTNADLINAIESYVKQGNLDGATEKLKALPISDPDYSRLRDSLDDAIFYKNTADAENALKTEDTPGRKSTLQSLLAYFQKVGMQNGRHSPVANRYAQNLDAMLNPKPKGDGGGGSKTGISTEDQAAIQAVLNRYSDAFNRRKAKDLRLVWPGIPSARADQFQQFFDSHKAIQETLTPLKWEPYGTGALVTCQQTLTYEQDGKQVSHPSPINFYMVKIQGTWRISDIPISADQ